MFFTIQTKIIYTWYLDTYHTFLAFPTSREAGGIIVPALKLKFTTQSFTRTRPHLHNNGWVSPQNRNWGYERVGNRSDIINYLLVNSFSTYLWFFIHLAVKTLLFRCNVPNSIHFTISCILWYLDSGKMIDH